MPSAKILEKKKAECAELTEKIKGAAAGVLVSYTGITVEQDTQLRKALREAGVDYKVYKNTMVNFMENSSAIPIICNWHVGKSIIT